MLGLIFLFCLSIGLWLWIYLTKVAMRLGGKLAVQWKPHHPKAFQYGRRAGFMLLMGGWWVWWGIEFILDWHFSRQMCAHARTTILITPKEWKELVGGEKVWETILYSPSYHSMFDGPKPTMQWEGHQYKLDHYLNDRLAKYRYTEVKFYSLLRHAILYDKELDKILYKETDYFHSNGSVGADGFDLSALKFWISEFIPECEDPWATNSPIYLKNYKKD